MNDGWLSRAARAMAWLSFTAMGLLGSCKGEDAGLPPGDIRVGILHSLSGHLASSERPLVDGSLLAIEEINEGGGILGRRITPVVADGKSEPTTFAEEAVRLIEVEHVCALFGCWTSTTRKEVRSVVEAQDRLLFYPLQYEGMESSPNIVYLGATPNQQVLPATKWCFERGKRRFFLIGSDYVFPRAANAVIKDYLDFRRASVVGEIYLPLGTQDVEETVKAIRDAAPDVILNTINGETNRAFFKALRSVGIDSADVPTVSFSMGEEEVQSVSPDLLAGDYAMWSYFASLDSDENRRFRSRFRAKFGPDRVTSDPVESAYYGVHLWARAVAAARSLETSAVREAVRHQCYPAPQGMVYVDSENQHTWQHARLGRICPDGQFEVVWQSQSVIHPLPYPVSRTRDQWERLLQDLHTEWGGNWAPPPTVGGGN